MKLKTEKETTNLSSSLAELCKSNSCPAYCAIIAIGSINYKA